MCWLIFTQSPQIEVLESETFRNSSTTQFLERAQSRTVPPPSTHSAASINSANVNFFPKKESRQLDQNPTEEGESDMEAVESHANSGCRKRRRIPGPAGSANEPILSDTRSGKRMRHPLYRHLQGQGKVSENDVFFQPAWLRLLHTWDLPPFQTPDKSDLLDYSIKYVVMFGYHKRVPRLFVVVKDVNITDVETAITFFDPTGEIGGTVHKAVIEKWGSSIKIGAVMCLKMVTVFNPTPYAHFLNVTAETVVDVIPPDCSPPPMSEEFISTLKQTDPLSIYVRRPELETDDPRFLHRLAQQQVR